VANRSVIIQSSELVFSQIRIVFILEVILLELFYWGTVLIGFALHQFYAAEATTAYSKSDA